MNPETLKLYLSLGPEDKQKVSAKIRELLEEQAKAVAV